MTASRARAFSERPVVRLTDEKIQDYIDGRLSERDRAVVAACLFVKPDVAARVSRLRLINEMIAGLGQQVLDEPVPDRLIEVLLSAPRNVRSG